MNFNEIRYILLIHYDNPNYIIQNTSIKETKINGIHKLSGRKHEIYIRST